MPLGALRRNRDVLPFYSLLLPLENSGHIGPHKGIFKPLGDGYLINASVGGAPELSVWGLNKSCFSNRALESY